MKTQQLPVITTPLEGIASLFEGEQYNYLSERDKLVVDALIEADYLQKTLDCTVNGVKIYRLTVI
jgi:hypothetical protein